MRKTPSFKNLKPSSEKATRAAVGSSKKKDTKPEVLLRKALWSSGLRYRKNKMDLPGIPDIVFTRAKLAIFVDGDFWHGKNWQIRKHKLEKGHNGAYWISKIERNMERDNERNQQLIQNGWTVIRIWESDIYSKLSEVLSEIKKIVE